MAEANLSGSSSSTTATMARLGAVGSETALTSLSAYLANPQALRELLDAQDQQQEILTNFDTLSPESSVRFRRIPRRRTFAGPPPPATWISQEQGSFATIPGRRAKQRIYGGQTGSGPSMNVAQVWSDRQAAEYALFRSERNVLARNLPAEPLSVMPSLLPRSGSLAHWCLLRLARDWEINVEYLQYYLPELDAATKMVLVSYLGLYSTNGIGIRGFRLLFDRTYLTEDHNSTSSEIQNDNCGETDSGDDDEYLSIDDSNDRITCLDFTFQIDDSRLTFLQKFMGPKQNRNPAWSWQHSLPTTRAFPFLTALSLSHPSYTSPTKLWSTLVTILREQPTLVALSLANWPIPPEMFYTFPESPAQTYPSSSPVATLRAISRTCHSLKWIDFSYCIWLDATAVLSFEWTGGWRGMKTLVLRGIDSQDVDKIESAIEDARSCLHGSALEIIRT